ncbi:MAG: hypothetical protein KGN16_13310 [Burkholderiales bacterium]|nr:hypothetical protein [Burkholderiales bacterium]
MKNLIPTACAIAALAALGFSTAAQARTEPELAHLLHRDATQQWRVERDVARGRLAEPHLAAVESAAAQAWRGQASALASDPAALRRVAAQEADYARAISAAERASRHARRMTAMERLHDRVATRRDAVQQQWIAHGARTGRLGAAQVAALETAQARIARDEAAMNRAGPISTAQALRLQHLQDVQDWAIRTGHASA